MENKLKILTNKTNKRRRIYPLNESFFDIIDTEEKAYFLGFLYADGCNHIAKGCVSLSLQEKDKEILEKLSKLLQPSKPLHKYKNNTGFETKQSQYKLVISSRHISEKLVSLGCMGAKTMILKFPTEEQLPKKLHRHFIRGYFDGDGCVESNGASLMGTLDFCKYLKDLVKENLKINFYLRLKKKYPTTEICLKCKSARIFLKWIYNDSNIFLKRKYEKYIIQLKYEYSLKKLRKCCVKECDTIQRSKNYCQYHYDQIRKNNKSYLLKNNIEWI